MTHPTETKALALAALMQGQSAALVSREYNIPESTIKMWRRELRDGKVTPDNPDQRTEVGDLLLAYLRANLAAVTKQMETFSDPKWLRQQSASELGVLHGILVDKSLRLVEIMSRAGGGQ